MSAQTVPPADLLPLPSVDGQSPTVVARFTVPGEPVSKARARFTGYRSGRAYTPEATRAAEAAVCAAYLRATGQRTGMRPADAATTYGVAALFVSGTRQRRDVDNMLKLLLDGLNRVAWVDDVQVVEVAARKSHDPAAPRTDVLIYAVGTVTYPSRPCGHCGQPVRQYPSQSRKYCSPECRRSAAAATRAATAATARERVCLHCARPYRSVRDSYVGHCSAECRSAATRADVPCSTCGTVFTKYRCHVRQHNYCSPACRDAAHTVKIPKGTCQDCGGPTSRKEYTRCHPCSQKEGGVPTASERTLGPSAAVCTECGAPTSNAQVTRCPACSDAARRITRLCRTCSAPVSRYALQCPACRADRVARGEAMLGARPRTGPAPALVRAWAQAAGYPVARVGRITPAVHAAYAAAHPTPEVPGA